VSIQKFHKDINKYKRVIHDIKESNLSKEARGLCLHVMESRLHQIKYNLDVLYGDERDGSS